VGDGRDEMVLLDERLEQERLVLHLLGGGCRLGRVCVCVDGSFF